LDDLRQAPVQVHPQNVVHPLLIAPPHALENVQQVRIRKQRVFGLARVALKTQRRDRASAVRQAVFVEQVRLQIGLGHLSGAPRAAT
jgi:hypothetical protein